MDIISRSYNYVARQISAGSTELLSPAQRAVLYSWWAKGIIDNGGFRYFYEGTDQALEAAEAFESLGLPNAAEAFRKSMHFFPGGCVPVADLLRQQHMDEHAAEMEKLFG